MPPWGPQEVLDRALTLARDGDTLIQSSHYAKDSIQPKCTELRAVSEEVSGDLRAKKEHLLKARELHHCLERVRRLTHSHREASFCLVGCCYADSPSSAAPQASKWVDAGIYLLASQPVDKCQSHEGAEVALQELERYLESAAQNQLSDLATIWGEYEAVLNQQLRVRLTECAALELLCIDL